MSTEPLNVIALISGGKDSLYSILHCIRNGHRVVALANLRPPSHDESSNAEDEEEDMDSFMYQTIGHNVIPLYESALGIPLYRGDITGAAVDTSRIYRDSIPPQSVQGFEWQGEDETESLIPLLSHIKRDLPHANAVSAGAILSTYQRTRIENVAGRLGLVPLAFLWMYPFLPPSTSAVSVGKGGLLDDMAAVGCDARIIKVASGGLDDGMLWENVAAPKTQRRLEKVMRPYVDDAQTLKGAILGEGGEYETLALDGPAFLWKKRIFVEENDKQVCRVDSGVSHVKILKARCVEKDESTAVTPEDVRKPAQFDEKFWQALEGLQEKDFVSVSEDVDLVSSSETSSTINISSTSLRNLHTISNITAPEAGPTADAQMRAITEKLQSLLRIITIQTTTISTNDIVFTTVLLRSMADFTPMNAIYVSLFTKPNPPARVTVACGDHLPDGVQVMISAVIDLGPRQKREGLHVQSRSYWAPANIGPYSQAITVPYNFQQEGASSAKGGLVYIAGQIPLDPPSMEIPGGIDQTDENWFRNFSLHATLSLQHLWRIGLATKVDWWIGAVVFLARDHRQRGRQKARIASRLWQAMHSRDTAEAEEEADLDIWDIKHGLTEDPRMAQGGPSLPNWEVLVDSDESTGHPPCFTVEVEQLPRNSDIEWQALGTTGIPIRPPVKVSCTTDPESKIWCTKLDERNGSFYTIEIVEAENTNLWDRIDAVLSEIGVAAEQSAHCTLYTSYGQLVSRWKGQVVPCHNVYGSDGSTIAAAITVQLKS